MGYIPIKTGRVADSTTSLKSILPIGATIYDVDAKKTYKLTANNVAADTITTLLAANKIVEVGGSTGVGTVTSFNTRTGAVVPAAGDYTKAQVGLGNVDNTADTAKPISTAQQTALDLKVAKAGDTMTGNLTINTPSANNFNLTSPIGKSIAMGIAGSAPEFSIVGSSTASYKMTSYDNAGTIQSALTFKADGNLSLIGDSDADVTPADDKDLATKKYVDDNKITPGKAIPGLVKLTVTPSAGEFNNMTVKINQTLKALEAAGIILPTP